MKIRAVTFDIDGTLTDAHGLRWPMFFRNVFRLRALRVGMQVREELRGTPFASGDALRAQEAEMVADRLDVDAAAARALLDDMFDRSLVASLRARKPDGRLRAALEPLVSAGLALGVVSDRRVDEKLAALGIGDLPFVARISADDTGRLKPDPETVRAAARVFGVEPCEIAHVGDRDDADGAAARAAGAAFFFVRGPHELPATVAAILDARALDGRPATSR